MDDNGKWVWMYGCAETWTSDLYDTRREAIMAALAQEEEEGRTLEGKPFVLHVGQVVMAGVSIDADLLLESMDETLYDECGEAAEAWTGGMTKAEIALLEERLNAVFETWMDETNNRPNCYCIENVEIVRTEERDRLAAEMEAR